MTNEAQFSSFNTANKEPFFIDRLGEQFACILLEISNDDFRAKIDAAHNPQTLDKLVSDDVIYGIEVRWATEFEIGGRILKVT